MMKVEMFNGAELEVGEEIRFADLWQTEDGDVEELLESECVHVATENMTNQSLLISKS